MKTKNKTGASYETPEVGFVEFRAEGILCNSVTKELPAATAPDWYVDTNDYGWNL